MTERGVFPHAREMDASVAALSFSVTIKKDSVSAALPPFANFARRRLITRWASRFAKNRSEDTFSQELSILVREAGIDYNPGEDG